jgi:hypothetical protein
VRLEKLALVGPRRAPRLDRLVRALDGSRHRGSRELDSGHTRGGEQRLLLGTAAGQLEFDQRPEMRRDDRGDAVPPGPYCPVVGCLGHHLLPDEFVDQGDQEQRIPPGALMQHPDQLGHPPGVPEPLGEVGGHGGFGESPQRQLHTLAVLPKLGEDRSQWRVLDHGLHGAIGAEQQEAGGIGTPRHRGEPGQRGAITPVQVFHHEHQGGLGLCGHGAQPPPLLPRAHAHSLAQSVAQQIGGIFHAPSAPQGAAIERRPPWAGPKAPAARGDLPRPFQQATVQLLRDQALPKNDQRALAAGWRLAIQTVQDQLPAASHRGGFDHCVIRGLSLGLEERRQGQWGRGHRGMALGLVFIERQQLLLKGLGKQLVAVLPQEHQELGPADACDDGLFSRRRLDGWMPQGWTHGKPSLWHSKEDERLPCYHLMEKYSTDVLGDPAPCSRGIFFTRCRRAMART